MYVIWEVESSRHSPPGTPSVANNLKGDAIRPNMSPEPTCLFAGETWQRPP